ncbi:hypothetical protein [Neorhizobium petrolearium]|jgi:hypothetical protein|uniref:hypothetical protein n=1 Tax=Neorhizobium petrolearium TaxID=515361 RepID=UPI003F15F605
MENDEKPIRHRAYTIRAKVKDIAKFSDGLSPAGAAAAAVALEAMRRIQAETGPGYVPLDIVGSALTEAYRRNWAMKQLGKAA